MNLLSRAITAPKILLSTHQPSRKCRTSARTMAALQRFSLYSTTKHHDKTTKLRTQQPRKPRTQKPSESLSSLPPFSWSEGVKKQAEASPTWPKPSEIPYQAKVANSVNLIGKIQMPVQFHATPDGKHLAATFIAQENGTGSSPSYSLMIPVVFEGDLAHIVACHVKQNDCVFVTGKLCVDPLPFVLSENQGKFHVLGREINFVQGFERILGRHGRKGFREVEDAVGKLDCVETENVGRDDVDKFKVENDNAVDKMWGDIVANPDEWWAIRSENDGVKGEVIGFERKDTGELVRIDELTPSWVSKKLEGLKFDDKVDQESMYNFGKTKDVDDRIDQSSSNSVGTMKDGDSVFNSWRDLVRNPKEWWDNRERKSNGMLKPNYPDFKHKASGTALWLNKAPSWALPGLQGLDFDVQDRKGQETKGAKEDDHWKSLVENPEKWWDNRLSKRNERAPDFRHKETGEGLWLNSSPDWVSSRLPQLKDEQIAC